MKFADGQVVVVATGNAGKVKEFAHAFAQLGLEVRSLRDYEGLPEIVEDGDTFQANARKKAKIIGDALQLPVLADDSGLCVDALDGAPGVYSARYAGEDASDADNNAKLLRELTRLAGALGDVPAIEAHGVNLFGGAQFRCALALYDPADGSFVDTEGSVEGRILSSARGTGGFGYDPLFWLPELGRSMAELTTDEKQAISHRGAALRELLAKLQ
ncbi:XTP/dITP diphosphohydrolase [Paenibacillus cellulosilyticus]|uniref:dITP/XTP pyrophosphatase n=1 Tax=Paenibacillus cellulosilyticus TaxID=375489 RepID=A0A2V2YJV9_9BACL|nr:RdgB/HAM1 family non-canonical purine NTP pyrophosphatase [Paenibacillus cellulosilyticus]PWV92048.1 XTP/dITP diphosphohydrolase [Paenibacillus cellulosilyticus]QKS46729.1 RdgB/HAM1 family non-canonical purine NTP pyrophosphatase [Paenibacillus cellulosilyticus]